MTKEAALVRFFECLRELVDWDLPFEDKKKIILGYADDNDDMNLEEFTSWFNDEDWE